MNLAWLIGSVMTKEMITDLSNKQRDSGGWVYTQLNRFAREKEIEKIVVISVTNGYDNDDVFSSEKMIIYTIKDNPIRLRPNRNTFIKIDRILKKEDINILDIQGTETTLSSYPVYSKVSIPMVNTLHGIAYQCYNFYTSGLPVGFTFWGRSLFDILFFHGIAEAKFLMKCRAKTEVQTLKGIQNVRGRTRWDKCCSQFINPNLCYYYTELIMRSSFYEYEWKIDTCKRNRIFVPQMRIPYKGCFILIEALKYIKAVFPNIEVHIPGAVIRKGFKKNGYEKYIWKLIKRNKLEKNIIFVGNLNAEQMAQELVEARVFLLPSIIENSPNSLTEAQLVGTPVVASLVGGVADYIVNEQTGLLYNSMDPIMCAQNIIRMMTDDGLSVELSSEAKKIAYKRHDSEKITQSILSCYKDILKNKKKDS